MKSRIADCQCLEQKKGDLLERLDCLFEDEEDERCTDGSDPGA